jgi:hypothetical protein
MFLSCLVHATNPTFSSSIMDLWSEFESGETKEAILVRDFDTFECLVQALEYERSQGVKSLQEFLPEADRIETPEIKVWVKHQLLEREVFWARKADSVLVIFVLGMAYKPPDRTRPTDLLQEALESGKAHSAQNCYRTLTFSIFLLEIYFVRSRRALSLLFQSS